MSCSGGYPEAVLLRSVRKVQRAGDGAARAQPRGPVRHVWSSLLPQDSSTNSYTTRKSGPGPGTGRAGAPQAYARKHTHSLTHTHTHPKDTPIRTQTHTHTPKIPLYARKHTHSHTHTHPKDTPG